MDDNDPYGVDPAVLEPQLTQARVPLEEAGDALMIRDSSGRIPIVVIPKRTSRVNPWLALAGVAALVAGARAGGVRAVAPAADGRVRRGARRGRLSRRRASGNVPARRGP